MAWMEDMQAAIAEDDSVTQSAVIAFAKLADQLQTAINSGSDPAAMQAIVDQIRANSTKLAAAIPQNTDAPAEPAPTPVPPEVNPETPA